MYHYQLYVHEPSQAFAYTLHQPSKHSAMNPGTGFRDHYVSDATLVKTTRATSGTWRGCRSTRISIRKSNPMSLQTLGANVPGCIAKVTSEAKSLFADAP